MFWKKIEGRFKIAKGEDTEEVDGDSIEQSLSTISVAFFFISVQACDPYNYNPEQIPKTLEESRGWKKRKVYQNVKAVQELGGAAVEKRKVEKSQEGS